MEVCGSSPIDDKKPRTSTVEFAHQTLEAYGVWQAKMLYGTKKAGIVRSTYLIGPEGRVKNVFANVKVEGHIHEVLAALKR